MNMPKLIFLLLCASSFMMTSLIWIVQLVHYPAFRYIEPSSFKKFCKFHQTSISFIVLPLMLIELGSLLYLSSITQDISFILCLILIIFCWFITFKFSMKFHGLLLNNGFDLQIINKLVYTNWLRTIAWSFVSILLFNKLFKELCLLNF